MKKFHYPLNHRADEAYMEKMCREGWAATRLVEGVWTFEPCRPGQYVYREAYLRGKSRDEVEAMKRTLAARGVQFVARYSFWAIFRSERPFELYTPEAERALCRSIRRPMFAGSAIGWAVFAAALVLALRVHGAFAALSVLAAAYAGLCTALAASYSRLIRTLPTNEERKSAL